MFWGLAAMTAAELKFPDRKNGFSWLSLAQGVFNTQRARWDTTQCGGGLRWQIYVYQSGYTMKNSVSNGGLFQLAARLARYTDNPDYTTWAKRIWNWSVSSPLVNNHTWYVADSTPLDCANAGNIQWTYNYGVYLMGAAYMYNYVSPKKNVKSAEFNEDRTFFFLLLLTRNDCSDRRPRMANRSKRPAENHLPQLLHPQQCNRRRNLRAPRNLQQQRNPLQRPDGLLARLHYPFGAINLQPDHAHARILRQCSRQILHGQWQQYLRCAVVPGQMGWVDRYGGAD